MTGRLIRVLVFVLATGALTAGILWRVSSVSLEARRQLVATFDDVGGLGAGDEVQLSGVPVGSVETVEVVDGRARVTFGVDADVAVPADSSVAVRWLNLIGQRELEIVPGDSDAVVADGDRLERTTSVVDLAELVDELGPFARTLSPGQVNDLLESLTTALEGNRGNVDRIAGDVEALLATLAERDRTVRRLLDDYAALTGALATRERQIRTMTDNLVTLAEALAGSERTLDDALVQLAGVSRDLDGLLADTTGELGAVVDDLATVTGTVRRRLGDLEAVVGDLPLTLREITGATGRGDYLAVNVTCVIMQFPPCPVPESLTGAAAPPADGAGPGPLDGTGELRRRLPDGGG